MSSDVRLRLSRLSKQFGSSVVLDDVSLEVRQAQIHGLIGQNGAGKSTLVKVLAGLYPDHRGDVVLDGRRLVLRNPRQSRSEGIAVIHQEFSLVPSMTVAENLLLGRETHRVRYSAREVRRRAEELLQRVAIDVGARLDAYVRDQSPAVMQRIEIAKALAEDARVLVMDEPTARLSDSEREWLFTMMRTLSDRGVGIMFISHFLEEVRGVTDWLTVLRNGRVVGSARTSEYDVGQMAELMLGKGLQDTLRRESHISRSDQQHQVVLAARRVCVGPRLGAVDVSLRAGEILGVAGLVGSGRTRLARVLAGVDQPTEGWIELRSRSLRMRSPRDGIANGIAYIPEDRKHQGLSMVSPVAENLCLMSLHRRLGRGGVVTNRSVNKLARQLVRDLEVSPSRVDLPASALSGGNQQKVLLGKALAAQPNILIIDQPTAGVDIGTKAQIHDLLHQRAARGAALMVVSDDIDELYALSDRLCVMRRGRVIWHGLPAQMERHELLALMSAGNGDLPSSGGS